jgi:hypothetical protein
MCIWIWDIIKHEYLSGYHDKKFKLRFIDEQAMISFSLVVDFAYFYEKVTYEL